MTKDPASRMQDTLGTGEHRGVNPAITDSSTYTFASAYDMTRCFSGDLPGAFLYNRHWNPTNYHLARALAAMENTEAAWITSSGMAAITNTLLQVCSSGDHIISNLTTYGGSYAFMKNLLPRFNISSSFVNITRLDEVKREIKPNTKVIYTESLTNPLLQVSDIRALASLANEHGITLVVDNTFTPMIITPTDLGAHITVHSMTKFINGKSDAVAGCICASKEFVDKLSDVNDGVAMLLGPVLDPARAASIHKNLFTLHIRMQQHSLNGKFAAEWFEKKGIRTVYPGLESHPQHKLFSSIMNPGYGFGGMLAIDLETREKANDFMVAMQNRNIGYIAVSLGYFKTLFSNSGSSTSSEIPADEQQRMGLSPGLVRFAIGLDNDIERTCDLIDACLTEARIR